ncbi:50S ribosomal protein L34 [Candidatus Uabimicrobium amorphum]|uniref:Large ribosomal subunit protein bL34 n=1 Tax=Uabimicrobium amorphum TaxID=2596890 RepID=A0A5S9F2E2_UABAM|nr:50S ribosomal protein L34 [Candidatus Uabimicrobium amorphum]BBM83161.1 50S ribosomal protein L34 [Candidatus Uabimicrobium amorphum]
MKVKTRKSSLKYRKKTGFLTRMKTRGGRAIISNQRKRRANKKN